MSKKNSGFTHIFIIIAVLVAIGVGVFLFASNKEQSGGLKFGLPDSRPKKSSDEICLMAEEYESKDYPKLSMPFYKKDFAALHWGFVPFCAHLRKVDEIHNAFDFELKPNSKVYAAADGIVDNIVEIKEQGARVGLKIIGDGFTLDYSGLGNVQVKNGDKVKKGDLLAYTQVTPFGEHHVHLGIFIEGDARCPIQYMDQEFKDILDEVLADSDWSNFTDAPCACNCEVMQSESK